MSRAQVISMQGLSNTLVYLLNGLLTWLGELASWPVIFGIIAAASLVWLAKVESDDVDTDTAKPSIGIH